MEVIKLKRQVRDWLNKNVNDTATLLTVAEVINYEVINYPAQEELIMKDTTTKYAPFEAGASGPMGDYSFPVEAIKTRQRGVMMCIATPECPIYITKQQAMSFFGLEERG